MDAESGPTAGVIVDLGYGREKVTWVERGSVRDEKKSADPKCYAEAVIH